jgi:hypothetical protein
MARAPRARVAKTSGQGVSRYSYQKGYSLGNRGTGSAGPAPAVKGERVEVKGGGGRRSKLEKVGDLNISYGDTLEIGDLADIKAVGKRKAPPTPGFLKQGKQTEYKKGKK